MALKKPEFNQLIHKADFKALFNKMGWNQASGSVKIKIGDHNHVLEKIAEKSAFFISVCSPDAQGRMPNSADRRKIDSKYRSTAKEHLIIYHDEAKRNFCWQFVIHRPNQPNQVAEVQYHVDPKKPDQEFEQLYQRAKGIAFSLEQENGITIFKVMEQVQANFGANAEKVTKKFYDGFKKQHTQFREFIEGIGNVLDKDWYTSIMLNRLMFCYFIQKKEFLDKDIHYLRNKLKASQEKKGKDQFYSFYRGFLLKLFHDGLNKNGNEKKELIPEIGRIPYLNGGLFDVHELEEKYQDKIQIPDKAFESLFTFFDEWTWHLDTRPGASEKEINPDVIGYIFEKYINERAKMGAYYTKEDITEYISKNCILPFLFEETRRNTTQRDFDAHFSQVLAGSTDRYIYPAVKLGILFFESTVGNEAAILKHELPADVMAGLDAPDETLVTARKCWNRPAPESIALPTEIYRELIERRKRYLSLRQKIENGEVSTISDFITFNLDIRQFAQDFLYSADDPELIRKFFIALSKVSILDPTCGSGAFLFAALNILEPLYETCLDRMQAFVSDEDQQNLADRGKHKNQFKDFREVLAQILNEQHPNRQYFIYKSIILNNLYGVDIMKEAVEIAKLRLFLKLVSTASADFTAKGMGKNYGLEPLPDIDFNIRCGNTLVGFATEEEVKRGSLLFQREQEKVRDELEALSKAFNHFRQIQLDENADMVDLKIAKKDYRERLSALKEKLDKSYHLTQGNQSLSLEKWKESHQPFHWFAEFFEIINDRGGFEVIVGNPPYVEFTKSKTSYSISGYQTKECGNLFAFVMERSKSVLNFEGSIGLIIPISSFSTERMANLQKHSINSYPVTYTSSFGIRPSKLFEGAEQRLTIFIGKSGKLLSSSNFSSKYFRWNSVEREFLFTKVSYVPVSQIVDNGLIPKIISSQEVSIFKKINGARLGQLYIKSRHFVLWHRIPAYFIKGLNFVPYFYSDRDGEKKSEDYKVFDVEDLSTAGLVLALLNSTVFYWFWFSVSDGYHCGKSEVLDFKFPYSLLEEKAKSELSILADSLMISYKENSKRAVRIQKTTTVEYDEFVPYLSKPIIDEIDSFLAKHYGFTAEELDFIINYDIKYRMGKELGDEENT